MTMPLTASVQMAVCGECWQRPGQPCGAGFDHLSRYLRAERRGLISGQELQRAVHLSVTVAGTQVIRHIDGGKL
jgi:hypothetical protein